MTSRAVLIKDRNPALRALKRMHFVSPLHTNIRGRARFKVRGLYRSPQLKELLLVHLRAYPQVRHIEANVLTSTVLVTYDPSSDRATIEKAIESLVQQAIYEKLTGVEATPTSGSAFKYTRPWHTLSKEETLAFCASHEERGLAEEKVAERLVKYGRNVLAAQEERSKADVFFGQFRNMPSALLMGSAVVSLLTSGLAEAGLIFVVVLVNGSIGFATEVNAEKTIRSLDHRKDGSVTVLRQGQKKVVTSDELVIGDVLLLHAGAVPADARVLSADHLQVDESSLTGESEPVDKRNTVFALRRTPLAERRNMLYKGTIITSGSGKAVVVATGSMTELGRIRTLSEESKTPETILQRDLRRLGNEMVFLSTAICAGVFVTGLLRGITWPTMLRSAISLAIAAVPEGLPTVGMVTLALGVNRLKQKNVIARTLHGVEGLGSIEVFCFDKTGTLTQNEMAVVHLTDASSMLLRVMALCTDATFVNGRLGGSATEQALLRFAIAQGVDPAKVQRAYPRTKTYYRTEKYLSMRTLHGTPDGGYFEAVKGSPEQVLEKCGYYLHDGEALPLSGILREQISAQNLVLAKQALRVLGFAYRENSDDRLIWLGMAGLKDPTRAGIKKLIADFHRAGIRTIMLTGDQVETARAVGEELGLSGEEALVVAPSDWLEGLDENHNGTLAQIARESHIFPRVSPSSKLKIVKALQHDDRKIVAMTGDGINDAPALRCSNIGIALGRIGSEAAKECADIVVTDDDLSTIYYAIMQGRAIKKNLRKSIHFLLATNLSEILVMFGGIVLGFGSPLNPLHLLWINLLTDVFPSLALAMEKADPAIMQAPPEDPSNPLFSSEHRQQMLREALLMAGGSLGTFAWVRGRGGNQAHASTSAFFALTFAQLLHTISISSVHGKPLLEVPAAMPVPLKSTVGLGVALLAGSIYAPGLNRLLGNAPLPAPACLVSLAGAFLPFLANEFQRRRKST